MGLFRKKASGDAASDQTDQQQPVDAVKRETGLSKVGLIFVRLHLPFDSMDFHALSQA